MLAYPTTHPAGQADRLSAARDPRAARAYAGLTIFVVVMAVTYNSVLAALAAHGANISFGSAAFAEVAILSIAGALVLSKGFYPEDGPALALMFIMTIIALLVSMMNDFVFVSGARNFLIIGIFTMLGTRSSEKTIRRIFLITTVIVLSVLIVEIGIQEVYVSIFQPARYMETTRGMGSSEYYQNGLSLGTIAYEGRFSLGLYSGPRTSSIFLEQVSINCFAIVSMIYLCTFFKSIKWAEASLILSNIVLIEVTNNARMALILAFVIFSGYFVFPRLSRNILFSVPVISFVCLFIMFIFVEPSTADNLVGRLSVTYVFLQSADLATLFGAALYRLRDVGDTGYGYLIVSTTLVGAIIYGVYLMLIVPHSGPLEKRCHWSVALYVLLWLMVGGTGSFSIKTAAPLWLMVGFARHRGLGKAHLESDSSFI